MRSTTSGRQIVALGAASALAPRPAAAPAARPASLQIHAMFRLDPDSNTVTFNLARSTPAASPSAGTPAGRNPAEAYTLTSSA